ncbi:MAG: carbamoyl-phosphate synthase large subunit, partial [Bacteroidaceae bacterium]|nr:carbamoyl-phosphate synthase large subunit [Bacteroidaceae bacterium]
IIEIGARMGGDFIGSDLVFLSTGIDFLQGVINCALGKAPLLPKVRGNKAAAVSYIFNQEDVIRYQKLRFEHPEFIVASDVPESVSGEVSDSSARFGYFVMAAERKEDLKDYLPSAI